MIRFLHTSDSQLGMTRHFLSEGAQERYSQAPFDAVRNIRRVAKDEECQFMLRDEGPEIELEAESGPYFFTYMKRFLKSPETRLTISKPKPENHTGREAHERAEAAL